MILVRICRRWNLKVHGWGLGKCRVQQSRARIDVQESVLGARREFPKIRGAGPHNNIGIPYL